MMARLNSVYRFRIRLFFYGDFLLFLIAVALPKVSLGQTAPDNNLYYRRTIGATHPPASDNFTNQPGHYWEKSQPTVSANVAFPSETTSNPMPLLQGPLVNGVDPNNLGQGDWIWEMSSCESALGVSTPQAVIDYEAKKGMQWVTVKAGDGVNTRSQWNSTIINEAHAKGLKIFAWVYAYGNSSGSSETGELAVAKWALSVGGDGLIIDAEGEYQGQSSAATAYASGIKAAYPHHFLAYAPFPYISYHSTFPYIQFGTYCDAVMPQDYWADIGVSVTSMVGDMDAEWSAWQRSLTGANTNAIKPIIPLGQGWNSTGYTEPASDITNFVWFLKNDPSPAGIGGYHGVSFWSCQHHTAAGWKGIATSVILAGTNQTVLQGDSATFAVNLPLGGAYHYQWKFNIDNIANATNASYTVTDAQSRDAGDYSVYVSNSSGCALNYSAILSVMSPLANSPGSVLAPPNMVNWWPEDGNGNDIFGTANATPQNGIYYTPGEVDVAIQLDGATGFLNTGASSLAPPWTVCLWVDRQNAPGTSAALFSDSKTNIIKLEQYGASRKVGISVAGVADYTFNYAAPANTWTHLAFVDDGSQIRLYANGVSVDTLALNFPLPRAYIGVDSFPLLDAVGNKTGRKFTDYMEGSLDEILVFSRALSAAEISAISSARSAGLVRAPEFTGVAQIPGGIQLNLRGQTGKNFTLYTSTNLVNWTLLGTLPNPTGAIQYLNSINASFPQTFYRVSQP
jgi:Concanavalin A-like lectin/glucanases superfamily